MADYPTWIRHKAAETIIGLPESRYEDSGEHELDYAITRGASIVVAGAGASAAVRAQADYLCDGTADEVQINAAIAALTAGRTWKETIECIGNFTCAAQVVIANYLILDLEEAYFTWDVADYLFSAVGTAGTGIALTNNEAAGSQVLELAATATFSTTEGAAGNYVRIQDEDTPVIAKKGEIHQVNALVTNTSITVDTPLWNSYTTADTAKATPLTMVHDFEIKGGRIVGVSATQDKSVGGIELIFCANFEVSGVTIINTAHTGIKLQDCTKYNVHDNFVEGCARASYGYGIVIYYGTNLGGVHHNTIRDCRHCFAGGEATASGYGAPMYINVDSNICINDPTVWTQPCLDFHESYSFGIKFTNNTLVGDTGIMASAMSWEASGNVINSRTLGIGLREQDTNCTDVVLRNNHFDSTTGLAIKLGNGSTYGTALANVEIDGVFLSKQIGSYAVFVYTPANAIVKINNVQEPSGCSGSADGVYVNVTSAGYVHITNCLVANCQRSGMEILHATGGIISDNMCYDNGQTGGATQYRSGIWLHDCTYLLIDGDYCFDSGGNKQYYGIAEAGTSDNNTLVDNKGWDNVTALLLVAGANTKEKSNDGYRSTASGTATVASGQTHIDVVHGLVTTPTRVIVTPTLLSAVTHWWVSGKGATEFIINVDQDPGAGTATFDWHAVVGEMW